MLDNEKIRIMTKLAFYESKEGKEDIKISKYYKSDYVRFELLKTLIYVTLAYLLVLLLVGVYKLEYLISEAVNLDFVRIGQSILGYYVLLLLIYVAAALAGFSYKYDKSRKSLSKYYKVLKKLLNIYEEENQNG